MVGVKTPQVELRPEMRGVARAQRIAPSGDRLFTLYSIPAGDEPVHDLQVDEDAERWAFIHVLDLASGTDFCIFLPAPMGEVNEAAVGLAMSPDGSTLWVVDPSTAKVARISTAELTITEVVDVPEIADPVARAQVAAADDGTVYVALGNRIHELAPGTLERTAVWESRDPETGRSRPVDALQVSETGAQLRYAADGSIVLINRATRVEIATLRGPEGGDLVMLGPPSGSAAQIPLECAC
ncbi:MAG: hypothetical protein R2695_12440 [Acidimicrobiales bacterium]